MFDEREYRETFSQVTASDETYRRILNMANQKKRNPGGRRIVVLIAAVIALIAVSVTAFAAESITSWFRNYFGRTSQNELTQEQIDYIEENEQTFAQSQTQDGYTLELKSAITDGKVAYVTIGITAPENVSLNATTIEGYDTAAPSILFHNSDSGHCVFTDSEGKYRYGFSGSSMEDYDGLANTQDLLFLIELQGTDGESPFSPEVEWNIYIEDLVAQYYDAAYWEELEATKYSGQENILLTDEEGEKMFPKVTLAEGIWEFTFRFENCELNEVELLSEPITTSACVGWKADGTYVYEDVTITSFKLRTFGATIRYDYSKGAPDFTNNYDKLIFAVMKDGSRVRLYAKSGGGGVQELLAESPIILENVDCILLADGIQIPMP